MHVGRTLNAAPSSSGRASCSNRSSGGVCSSSASTSALAVGPRRRQTSGRPAIGAAIAATPREKQGASSLTFSTLSGPLKTNSSDSLSMVPHDSNETTTVRFWLKFKTSWGEGVKLIGSHPKLGSWTISNAVELRWAEGDAWTVSLELPPGVYEYKYVVIDYSTKQPKSWQQGGNSVLAINIGEKEVDVHDNWGNNPGAEVRTAEGESMTRENKLQQWASTLVSQFLVVNKEKDEVGAQLAEARMENQVVKGELGRVKMELGLMQQAQRERDAQVTSLKEQNIKLQQDLTQAQQELASSFAEALQLLEDDDDDDFFRAESEALRNGNGKASSNGKASASSNGTW